VEYCLWCDSSSLESTGTT